MASVLTPPILDSTGSEIVEKLQTLKQNIHASSSDKEIIYNGVYPDYSNLIHSFTIPDGGGYVGWTATQDCFAVISNAYTGLGNSMNIKINDVAVVTCYTDMTNVSSALLGHFASFYLKKGDVFEVSIPTNMAGADSSAKFYGLRKGTIEREITVDGLLAPTPAIYSSDEQQVGIWTDGKPLYQKSYQLTVTENGNYELDPNLEFLVNAFGVCKQPSNNEVTINYVNGSTPAVDAACFYYRKSDNTLNYRIGSSYGSGTWYITIQYTKTTDTAWESGGFKAYGFSPIIYSDVEREIGVWRNGKPLYQKVVNYGALPSASGSVNKAHNISNVDDIFISGGYLVETSGNDKYFYTLVLASGSNEYNVYTRVDKTNVRVSVNTDRSSMSAFVVVQYTKTTDTPGSGKYTTIGTPAVHYSTDEHIIGTWIDGSTIYQKTFQTGIITIPPSGQYNVEISDYISNMEMPLDAVICSSLKGLLPKRFETVNSIYSVSYAVEDGRVKLTRGSADGTSYTANLFITLQYTKTS